MSYQQQFMSRSIRLYIIDIVTSIERVQRYTDNIATQKELIANELVVNAVSYNLLIIGEAVKKIPTEVRAQYPQIEWRKIAGLRDFLAHAYFEVNPDVLWDVIQNKLPILHKQITPILDRLDE